MQTTNRVTGGLRRARVRVRPTAQLLQRRLRGRSSPYQMTLSLTNRCNFRCTYCHIPLQERDELSTDQWRDAIDELAAAGTARVSFMGGEPLLREDAGALVAHAKAAGLHSSLNTNGWFVPRRIDELAELDLVCVTLDGPPEVHDSERHRRSHGRVLEAIEVLRGRGVKTVTMTVLTDASVETTDHVLDVARRFGIQAFFQLEHDAVMEVNRPVAPAVSDERVGALTAHLARRKREGWPVGNSFSMLELQGERRILGGCDDCFAGRYFGYVLPDGTVSHCLFTQHQVEPGNGKRRGFARAFDELPPPRGEGCSCVPSHEVNRMLRFDPRVLRNAIETALTDTAS